MREILFPLLVYCTAQGLIMHVPRPLTGHANNMLDQITHRRAHSSKKVPP